LHRTEKGYSPASGQEPGLKDEIFDKQEDFLRVPYIILLLLSGKIVLTALSPE